MDGNKLELTAKPKNDLPASYKAIPEADLEEEKETTRSYSLVSPEVDGADEKMLPKEEEVKVSSPIEKQNGDAKLDIGEIKDAFVGLTKEELMKYANDPFWVQLRWVLFVGFWILWALMLVGAIIIIVAAPKCKPPPPRTWWEKGPLAEVKQEFSEAEIKKLKELEVTGVIMSWPEDVYANLDATIEESLKKAVKQYTDENINVILELEPGYSKVWFNKSQFKDSEFNDYYIWQPPKDASNGEMTPPNNWISIMNTSSWLFSDERKEFYYAPGGTPHLNFRNPNVTEEFSKIIKKFLGYGVGGIRLKGAPNLLVDAKFTDESVVQNRGACVLTDYCFYTHTQTENLNELAPLLKQWRDVVKNNTDNGPFMIAEDLSMNIEAYKLNSSYVVDLPLQSHLVYKTNVDVSNMYHTIHIAFNANNFTWPLWKGNASSEWDIVTYLLPGTPLITVDALVNKDLLKARNSPSIMRGSFKLYSLNKGSILAFTRVTAGNPGTLVVFNPGENRTEIDFQAQIKGISEEVTAVLFSTNYNETDMGINLKHPANSVPMSPKSALVLSYVPKAD